MGIKSEIKFKDGQVETIEGLLFRRQEDNLLTAVEGIVAAFGGRYGGVRKVVVTDGDGDKWVFKP